MLVFASILFFLSAFSNLKPGNPGGKLLSLSASACHIGETGAKLIDLVPLSSLYVCTLVFFPLVVFLRFVFFLYLAVNVYVYCTCQFLCVVPNVCVKWFYRFFMFSLSLVFLLFFP